MQFLFIELKNNAKYNAKSENLKIFLKVFSKQLCNTLILGQNFKLLKLRQTKTSEVVNNWAGYKRNYTNWRLIKNECIILNYTIALELSLDLKVGLRQVLY